MINNADFKRMINLLDKGELEKLKEYMEKENEKYNLSESQKAFVEYQKKAIRFMWHYTVKPKFIFSDRTSCYILYDNELLSDKDKKLLGSTNVEAAQEYVEMYNSYIEKEFFDIMMVNPVMYDNMPVYEVDGPDQSFYQLFDKNKYNMGKRILGPDTKYQVCEDYPLVRVKSKKGEGLIFGLRKSDKK